MSNEDQSNLQRCVSAEIRATMASRRVSGKALSGAIGLSQNYLAKRLRDEAPFTLDDIERVVNEFGLDPAPFITKALNDHMPQSPRPAPSTRPVIAASIDPFNPKGSEVSRQSQR